MGGPYWLPVGLDVTHVTQESGAIPFPRQVGTLLPLLARS
jgi:hypothetical protein